MSHVCMYVCMYVLLQGVSQEESKLEPWTLIAKYHLKVEQELKNVEKLVSACLLVSIVYN